MRIKESGYKTHCWKEVDWKYSASAQILYIYIRVSNAIVRIAGSGYETYYRQEVDWKYSISVQILYTLWSVMWDKQGDMKLIIGRK